MTPIVRDRIRNTLGTLAGSTALVLDLASDLRSTGDPALDRIGRGLTLLAEAMSRRLDRIGRKALALPVCPTGTGDVLTCGGRTATRILSGQLVHLLVEARAVQPCPLVGLGERPGLDLSDDLFAMMEGAGLFAPAADDGGDAPP